MKKFIIIVALAAIANFSFAQQLQKGNLIGVHAITLTLKPGVTMEQVENFYTQKLIPAYENAFEGTKGYLIKARRGENENKLGIIWWFKTEQDRDKYFTSDGFTEAGNAAMAKIEKWDKERDELATETDTYTDWVVQ
jgi:hypothetical protein